MKIDIFYKSYSKDYKWLYHSLASIKKYITGYNKIIIVIPESEAAIFDNSHLPERTEVHTVNESGNGYLFQQYVKMTAHHYSSADYVLFADSDCIFNKETDITTLIKDGKPDLLYTPYSKVGDAICWKAPTEKVMGMEIPFEFMRRNCAIYRRSTLNNLEQFLNRDLKKYILSQHAFSEFNVMGAYAFYNERDKYNIIDTETMPLPDQYFRQFWSWSGLTKDELKEIQSIL